jgi:beta-glucosidase/6-phospho-beta-glucosidase/beta-galactosidase
MREIRYTLLTTLVALAALLPAASARANPTQASLVQDDPQLTYTSSSHRTARLNELQSLGIDIVKVRVNWRFIAPKKRPRGFNGADPAAYGAAWTPYDELVSGAQARGMDVMFQLGTAAPEWATPGKSAIRSPNPAEFGKFAEAVGKRYPSVHLFSVWNEPNLVSWLSPQYSGKVPASPRIYRGLLNAVYGGMQRSGHGSDQLLVGELLPFSRSSGNSTK